MIGSDSNKVMLSKLREMRTNTRGGGRGRGYGAGGGSSGDGGNFGESGYGGGALRRKRYDDNDDYDAGPRAKRLRNSREMDDGKSGGGYSSGGMARGGRDRSPARPTSPYRSLSSSSSNPFRRDGHMSSNSSYSGNNPQQQQQQQQPTAYSVPPPKATSCHSSAPLVINCSSAPLSYQDYLMREMRDYSSRAPPSSIPPMAFPPPPPFAPLSPPRYYDPPPLPDYSTAPPPTSSSSSRSSRSAGVDKPHARSSNVESYDRSVAEFLQRNRDRRRDDSRERRSYRDRR
ncbi:hypothetical protein FHG87_013378 [Trinorchestia longiramus]|nr:hypothetical protein FHG87_013378 [Trinorchestia longiramus]